jgi:hypothetical protein
MKPIMTKVAAAVLGTAAIGYGGSYYYLAQACPSSPGLQCTLNASLKCIHVPGNTQGYPKNTKCHVVTPPSSHCKSC